MAPHPHSIYKPTYLNNSGQPRVEWWGVRGPLLHPSPCSPAAQFGSHALPELLFLAGVACSAFPAWEAPDPHGPSISLLGAGWGVLGIHLGCFYQAGNRESSNRMVPAEFIPKIGCGASTGASVGPGTGGHRRAGAVAALRPGGKGEGRALKDRIMERSHLCGAVTFSGGSPDGSPFPPSDLLLGSHWPEPARSQTQHSLDKFCTGRPPT